MEGIRTLLARGQAIPSHVGNGQPFTFPLDAGEPKEGSSNWPSLDSDSLTFLAPLAMNQICGLDNWHSAPADHSALGFCEFLLPPRAPLDMRDKRSQWDTLKVIYGDVSLGVSILFEPPSVQNHAVLGSILSHESYCGELKNAAMLTFRLPLADNKKCSLLGLERNPGFGPNRWWADRPLGHYLRCHDDGNAEAPNEWAPRGLLWLTRDSPSGRLTGPTISTASQQHWQHQLGLWDQARPHLAQFLLEEEQAQFGSNVIQAAPAARSSGSGSCFSFIGR